jgi:hypothetical protein
VFPLARRMPSRSAIVKILSWIVAAIIGGIVIAGQVFGWSTIISSVTSIFPSATIESSSVRPFSSGPFFAGEKIWLRLKGVEVERVYWPSAYLFLLDYGTSDKPRGPALNRNPRHRPPKRTHA